MLSEEDLNEINHRVRKEIPLPEKACPSKLSKVFARREFAKRQYIKEKEKQISLHQKKKEYETIQRPGNDN